MAYNLEERMEARGIVSEIGMSTRPEFYSGRGAIACDLNDAKLGKIYQGIQREHGEDAAKQFAQMVADIPKLSATDFLVTLYRLEAYQWDKKLLGDEKGIAIGPDLGDESREQNAMWGVLGVLLGDNERDETEYIRGEFLKRHGIKTKTKAPRDNRYGYYWDWDESGCGSEEKE